MHPHTLFTPLCLHSLWAQQSGLAEKSGLLRGPALPGTGDQPGEGECGILSGKTQELSFLLVSRHSSLRLYRFGGFHCSSGGQQELKVFSSYISLYMVLSIVRAKYSQAKPGGDFSAVVRGQQPLHSHSPPQSNADVRSHSLKSRMPVNSLLSHCQACEPGAHPLSGLHDSSF